VVVRAGVLAYWYATGVTSLGHSEPCTSGSAMYYVPAATALNHTGLSVVTG
jgi:hypothetical protein